MSQSKPELTVEEKKKLLEERRQRIRKEADGFMDGTEMKKLDALMDEKVTDLRGAEEFFARQVARRHPGKFNRETAEILCRVVNIPLSRAIELCSVPLLSDV